MASFLEHLRERWNNWVGDRDMELAIREHLSEQGFYGRTAKLRDVRLVAVQRPGWIQVFRFETRARVRPDWEEAGQVDSAAEESGEEFIEVRDAEVIAAPEYRELLGLVRVDARQDRSMVRLFEDDQQRRLMFGRWSEGMIRLRGAKGLVEP